MYSLAGAIVGVCVLFSHSSELKGQRQGYMGHLIKIVNKILHCGENDLKLGQMLKDAMEEDIQKRWNEFISGTVADTNRKNETNLVSFRNVQLIEHSAAFQLAHTTIIILCTFSFMC